MRKRLALFVIAVAAIAVVGLRTGPKQADYSEIPWYYLGDMWGTLSTRDGVRVATDCPSIAGTNGILERLKSKRRLTHLLNQETRRWRGGFPGITRVFRDYAAAHSAGSERYEQWPRQVRVLVRKGRTGAGSTDLILGPNKLVIPWVFPGARDSAMEKRVGGGIKEIADDEKFDPDTDIYVDAVMATAHRMVKDDLRTDLERIVNGGGNISDGLKQLLVTNSDFQYLTTLPSSMTISVDEDRWTDEVVIRLEDNSFQLVLGWKDDRGRPITETESLIREGREPFFKTWPCG